MSVSTRFKTTRRAAGRELGSLPLPRSLRHRADAREIARSLFTIHVWGPGRGHGTAARSATRGTGARELHDVDQQEVLNDWT
jgi:hypothetical protein